MEWKTRKITTCINLAYPRRFVDKTHCCPDKIFSTCTHGENCNTMIHDL